MDKVKEFIKVVCVLCIVAGGWYLGSGYLFIKTTPPPVDYGKKFTKMIEEREQQLKDAKKEATTSRSASDILYEQMSSLDEDLLKVHAHQRKASASAGFLSAYWANGSVRSEYCESIGVSVGEYISQFKAMNDDLLKIAKVSVKKHIKESGKNLTLIDLFLQIRKMHKPIVEQDMLDSAYKQGKSTEQLCRDMEADPVMAVASLSWSRMNPYAYSVLTGKAE